MNKDIEMKERMINSKKKYKRHRVYAVLFVILLILLACGGALFYKISEDNKYIFLYKAIEKQVVGSDYDDSFEIEEDTLVLVNGFKMPKNKALIITKNGGLVNGIVSGKLQYIDKMPKDDFYKATDLYTDKSKTLYLSEVGGTAYSFTKDGIKGASITNDCVLQADNVSLFDNNVDKKYNIVKAKNLKGEEVEVPILTSSIGNVIGIDVNKGETYLLEEILLSKNSIKNQTVGEDGDIFDTTEVAGKIGFVYIKIGSSSYSKENNFSIIPNVIYSTYAAVCEKYQIPYGFYYYSTAITEEEANKEYDTIVERLSELENSKYNVLPIAIDVELADDLKKDRQVGHDVTSVKAVLANKLYEKYGKTVLYTSGRTASIEKENRIIDLVAYKSAIKEKLNLWTPAARLTNGTLGKLSAQYLEELSGYADTVFEQSHLDLDDKNGFDYDIDFMTKALFTNLVK